MFWILSEMWKSDAIWVFLFFYSLKFLIADNFVFHRFGQKFVDKVANLKDILLFTKRKAIRAEAGTKRKFVSQ